MATIIGNFKLQSAKLPIRKERKKKEKSPPSRIRTSDLWIAMYTSTVHRSTICARVGAKETDGGGEKRKKKKNEKKRKKREKKEKKRKREGKERKKRRLQDQYCK